jgi:hypothetical protein
MGIIFIAPTKTSSQIRREKPKASEQSLTGEKAVDELKRSGGYESLNEAFKKASGMSLGDPEPANLLPGGAYEQIALTASDGATNDLFGFSVAVDGDTAVVGAYDDEVTFPNQGSAYVFIRSGSTWTQQGKLTASDGAALDSFGTSVAIFGDSIVVGTSGNPGSAYVFTRSGGTWTEQQKLTASDGAAGDYFAYSVAISGDTVVAGASYDDIGANSEQGSAYVFTRSGSTWTEQQKLTASDGAAGDFFGYSVAIAGDTIVVAASDDDIGSNVNQGSAYVFTRSGSTWTEQQKLTASDGAAGDYFGFSVAIAGDTIVVGAIYDNAGQGSAYVFTLSGSTWTEQENLTASDGAAMDYFGWSVAIAGDTIVVGAIYDNGGQGSAYVFARSGSTWTEQQKLIASDGAPGDFFGFSVAVSGDTILTGASNDDVGTNGNQGSAKIFQTKMTISKVIASDGAQDDWFGHSVAISGDTAVVGARQDTSNNNQGSAYIFKRSGGIWVQLAKLVASDGAAGDFFGHSVAVSSDHVVVGAPLGDVGQNMDQGSAYVFRRSGNSWAQEAKLVASDGAAGDSFGISVAISGDDVVVGAHLDDVGQNIDQGSAYVFTHSSSTWTEQAKLVASDGVVGDNFGFSVGVAGNHAVVGAPVGDVGQNMDQGSAYVFRRSGGTWAEEAKLVASDGAVGDQFGYSVAIHVDTVVVGAPVGDVGQNMNQGSAYVFTRSGTSWPQQAKLVASDGATSDFFGNSVAISGETAIVGAWHDDVSTNTNQGSAYVFERYGATWSQQRQLIASDGAANDFFGIGVAISGETAIVGADWDDIGSNSNQGSAYIYHWGTSTPTSAGASLSGRVLETNGRGLANATVILTDSMGVERTVQTGSFGRFSFSDLPSGETYIVSVRAKRFVFSPQVVSLQSDLSDVRLEASGRSGR